MSRFDVLHRCHSFYLPIPRLLALFDLVIVVSFPTSVIRLTPRHPFYLLTRSFPDSSHFLTPLSSLFSDFPTGLFLYLLTSRRCRGLLSPYVRLFLHLLIVFSRWQFAIARIRVSPHSLDLPSFGFC